MRLLPLLLLATLPAAAQVPVALPDSVVVTASRTSESTREVGRRVRVVTAAEIAALPVASVDELLRAVAGVEVFSRGPFGVQSDFTVRGSTFNGVLLLIDGVRFNDPMTGHFLSDLPIPLSEIARVEVLRGAAAAEYGADAVGGVIHVQTRAGLPAGPDEPGWSGRGGASGGTHALALADGAASAWVGAARYTVAAAAARSDGQAVPSLKTDADGRPEPAAERASFERGAATVGLRRPLGGATLSARAAFDARDFDAVRFYTGFASDTAREQTQTLWLQAALEGTRGRTLWRVQGGARRHEDTYRYRPGSASANHHVTRQATLTAYARHAATPGLALTLGADALGRSIDSNNAGEHADAAGGVWGGGTWRAGQATFNARLRVDYAQAYGFEVTPAADVVWNALPALDLRAAAARAVRAPTYVERYFNTLGRPRSQNVGNPDLSAERAVSYEAGADLYLARLPDARVALHLTGFTRTVDNLIDFALAPGDTVFFARNLRRVATRGLEAEVSAAGAFGPARLQADLGYTFLDAALDGLPKGVEAKYALTNARHLGQAHVRAEWRGLGLGVQSLVRQPARPGQPAYAVHNVRTSFALPLAGLDARLTAEVRNVTDRRYAEVFAPMPGRWWVFGVRAGF